MTVRQRAVAWSVHLFTGLGLVAAAWIAVLIVRGGDNSFRAAFGLMWLATLIDAVDGTFAKMARVGEVLPGFDGRRLDDIIDFQTYTSLPLLLIWRAGILPGGWSWVLLFPLLASAFGFSRVAAKTDDGYFLGFPSYWNIVAFYLYTLAWPRAVNAAIVVAFSLAVFVPIRYLYPSRTALLRPLTVGLGLAWGAAVLYAIFHLNTVPHVLVVASLAFPVYYVGLSLFLHLRRG